MCLLHLLAQVCGGACGSQGWISPTTTAQSCTRMGRCGLSCCLHAGCAVSVAWGRQVCHLPYCDLCCAAHLHAGVGLPCGYRQGSGKAGLAPQGERSLQPSALLSTGGTDCEADTLGLPPVSCLQGRATSCCSTHFPAPPALAGICSLIPCLSFGCPQVNIRGMDYNHGRLATCSFDKNVKVVEL